MLKNVALGTYYPGNSLIHRLQARTKLLALFLMIIWLILANQHHWHLVPYAAIVAVVLLTVGLARISPMELIRRTWLLVLLLLLGFPISLFLPRNGEPIIGQIGPYMTTYGTLRNGLMVSGLVSAVLVALGLVPIPGGRDMWLRKWLRRLRLLFVVVTLLSLFALWLNGVPAAHQRFTLGPFLLGADTTWFLLVGTITLLVLFSCSLLVTMTTTPVGLIEGLTLILSPLRRLKFPVDDFALMTLVALRFIPTLIDEVELLIKAQMARGADMTQGSVRERIQSLAMLFVPLMQGTLRHASELAVALEARGYEVEGQQTMLYEKKLNRVDYTVIAVLVVLIVGTLWF